MVGKKQLVSNAIYVEQDIMGEHVGSQDQVAAAFGGLNRMEFNSKEDFLVQPVTVNQKKITELQNHLMFFFTGFSKTEALICSSKSTQATTNPLGET